MNSGFFNLSIKTFGICCVVGLLGACARSGADRAAQSQTHTQTISDILAKTTLAPLAFKDYGAVNETLSSIAKSDLECAVVIQPDGTLVGEYTRLEATVGAKMLAALVKKSVPDLHSGYVNDLNAYVALSPITSSGETLGYVVVARR